MSFLKTAALAVVTIGAIKVAGAVAVEAKTNANYRKPAQTRNYTRVRSGAGGPASVATSREEMTRVPHNGRPSIRVGRTRTPRASKSLVQLRRERDAAYRAAKQAFHRYGERSRIFRQKHETYRRAEAAYQAGERR